MADSGGDSGESDSATSLSRGPVEVREGDGAGGRRVLLAITALALALRWLSWERTAVIFNDGPRFLRQAQAILEGDWGGALAEAYHPLYAAITAVFAALATTLGLGEGLESAAALVSVLAGSAAVAVLYRFLRDAFGAPYDWMGALLFAIHPRAIEFSSDIQSEGLYLLFFLAAIALAWRALESASTRAAAAAGLTASLAFWTRPEGIGVALIALVLCPLWARRNGWGVALALRWAGLLALGAALGVAAYSASLELATGQWRLTQKKELVTATPPPGPAASPPPLAGKLEPLSGRLEPLRTLRPRPGKGPGEALGDLWSTARSTARPLILVGWIAALLAIRTRPGPRAIFTGAVLAGYGAVLFALLLNAGYVSRRHLLPPFLPLFGYAAWGLFALGRAALGRWSFFLRLARPAPLLVGAMLAVPFQIKPRRIDKLAEREAAEWVAAREPLAEGEMVAGIGGRVGYYANRPMIDFRGFDAAELPDALARYGVDLAVSARGDWIEALGRDPRYQAIHTATAGGREARVFRRRETLPPPSGLSN